LEGCSSFAEFLWADFFRPKFSVTKLQVSADGALAVDAVPE
jgi:hypothetical protein